MKKYSGIFALFGLLCLFYYRYQTGFVSRQGQIERLSNEAVALVEDLKPKGQYFECSLLLQDEKFLSRISTADGSLIAVGDLLLLEGILKPLPTPGRKEQFDYGEYLHNLGFSGLCEVERFAKIGRQANLRFAFKNWQLSLAEKVDKWKLGKLEAELLKALFLGIRGGIDRDTLSKFKGAGLMHLLAVSGLHLGIVYLVLTKILSLLHFGRYHRYIKSIFLLIGIWSFCFLSGAGPSVIRAATMFSLLSFSGLIRRRLNSLSLVFSSFILLLWIKPMFIHQLGFLLSYSAVIGILFLVPKLQGWYQPKNKIASYAIDLIYVSIAAQLFTAPLSLYSFGSFPVYFLVANLVMLPVISLIMYWGLVYFALAAFKLPSFFIEYYNDLLGFPLKFSERISSWPNAQIDIHVSLLSTVLGLAFLFIWVLKPKLNPKLLFGLALSFWLIKGSYALYLKNTNPISIYLDSKPKAISIYANAQRESLLTINLDTVMQKAHINAHCLIEPLENGMISFQSPFLKQEVLLVDEFEAISDSLTGLVAYYGNSPINEKSWRSWCQDSNLKFISARNNYVELY